MEKSSNRELVECAMGRIEPTVLIHQTKIVNVFTGEIEENKSVVIYKDKIAAVMESSETKTTNYIKTQIIDGSSLVLTPGLMDAHLHVESSMLTLEEFVKVAIRRGTTGIVIDPHELVNVAGKTAFDYLINVSKKVPITVYFEVPSCVPATTSFETSGASLDAEKTAELLEYPEVVALAEMMNFPGVIYGDEEVHAKLEAARKNNKIIEGHAPGLSRQSLSAYLAAGVRSDHEQTTPEGAMDLLRLGATLQVRHGSFANDLPVLVSHIASIPSLDTRKCVLASDDKHADQLISSGHMDQAIRACVENGLPIVKAIQWATINVAQHLGLTDVGGIAPGMKANIVSLTNLEDFKIAHVFADGQLIVEGNKIMIEIASTPVPEELLSTVKLNPVCEKELFIPSEDGQAQVIVAIEGSLFTEKELITPLSNEGVVIADTDRDIIPIIVINRHTSVGNMGKGLIKGLGLKNGAIGGTVAHDSHNVIVTGTNYSDMVIATNRLISLGGGFVVVKDREIIAELPLPICGLLSDKQAEEVALATEDLGKACNEQLGSTLSNPLMALSFMALPVIPRLKLTDKGLIDVDKFKETKLFLVE